MIWSRIHFVERFPTNADATMPEHEAKRLLKAYGKELRERNPFWDLKDNRGIPPEEIKKIVQSFREMTEADPVIDSPVSPSPGLSSVLLASEVERVVVSPVPSESDGKREFCTPFSLSIFPSPLNSSGESRSFPASSPSPSALEEQQPFDRQAALDWMKEAYRKMLSPTKKD